MSLPVHVSKMDDVIKRLICNSKLILFTHSPYIIKPYKLWSLFIQFTRLLKPVCSLGKDKEKNNTSS